MGGTMPYARFRTRNGLVPRKMEGNPYSVGEGPQDQDRYLTGELNRMEQSYMGVYADLPDESLLGAKATGLTLGEVHAVLRWFFGLPEPDCEGCASTASHGTSVYGRCLQHEGYA